jgi:hypothetical protein
MKGEIGSGALHLVDSHQMPIHCVRAGKMVVVPAVMVLSVLKHMGLKSWLNGESGLSTDG